MSVRALMPTVEELGQCEAYREARYANDKPSTDKHCAHPARYEIDGKRFCTKHAGVAALAILLNKGAT